MGSEDTDPFGSAAQWTRRSAVDGEPVIVASPHAIEDGHETNLDVWVRYQDRDYAATAYSVADVARLVARDFVQYDVSWFVVETISEDSLVQAVAAIIASGGLNSVFQPMTGG